MRRLAGRPVFFATVAAGLLLASSTTRAADAGALNEEQLREMSSRGASVKLVLQSEVKKELGVRGLSLKDEETPLQVAPSGGKLFSRIELRGTFDRPGWVLFAQKSAIAGPAEGPVDFRSVVQLNTGTSQVQLTAVGPNGEVEKDALVMITPDIQEYRVTRSWGEIMAAVGAAHISYAQSGFSTLYTANVAFGLDYTTPRFLNSPWGLVARGRLTFFPLMTSIAGEEPQMVDARADLTYRFKKKPKSRWEYSALVGLMYQTTLTYGSKYGFYDLASFDWGARINYSLGEEKFLRGDLRYSPLGDFPGGFSEEWALCLDVTWSRRLKNQKRLNLTLGLNNIAFNPAATSRAQLNWVSLLVGYSL